MSNIRGTEGNDTITPDFTPPGVTRGGGMTPGVRSDTGKTRWRWTCTGASRVETMLTSQNTRGQR